MIELKLTGTVADYVDTDALNEQVRNDIKWAIKEQVSKLIKDDKEFQQAVYSELTKQIIELHMNDNILNILQSKIKAVAESLDDYTIKYYSGMEEKVKELFTSYPEYTDILNELLEKAISKYEVDKYTISSFVTDLLTNDSEYQDRLKELVGIRTEALFDRLACD